MIKKYLFITWVLSTGLVYGQVGINNTNPKSTFHVIASKTDGTTAEGIIAPNLTRAQLITKDGQYGSDQRGAIVYVTTIDGTATTKTTNVTLSGYYYFNGTEWVSFRSATAVIPTEPWQVQGSITAATSNAENIYQMGSVAVGSNSAGSYKFQVTGASNITGNSRVASSSVVGNETMGGTLSVTGAASLASTLAVTGNSALGGSVGIGIASPAQKLHVVGNQFTSGISKLGGTTTYNSSAQLELSDNNKGFLPNRVALTGSTIKAPVTNAVDGMVVYNTATETAQGLTPGLYYWRGTSWQRLVDEIPVQSAKMYYQTANVRAGYASGGTQTAMTSLNFSPTRAAHAPVALKLPETGSYAFNVKLYVSVGNTTGPNSVVPQYQGKVIVYVGIWINNVLQDVSEVFSVIAPRAGTDRVVNGNFLTNVVLGCIGKAGDAVDIRVGFLEKSLPVNNYIWSVGVTSATPRSDATSLVFWKL